MNTFRALATRLCLSVFSLILASFSSVQLQAQTAYTPDVGNVGLPANGVFHGGSIDTVQLNNGNVHIDIPLLHLPGIGLDTDIHLTYDSLVWNQAIGPTSPTSSIIWTLVTMSRPPWQLKDPLTGYLKRGQHTLNWNCAQISGNPNEGGGQNTDIDFTSFIDEDGSAHPIPIAGLLPSGSSPVCSLNGVTGTWPTLDTTGDASNGYYPVYSVDQAGYNFIADGNGNPVHFYDRHGTSYTFTNTFVGSASSLPAPLATTPDSCGSGSACGSQYNPGGATNVSYVPVTTVEDSNGNRITQTSNSSSATMVDTVGRSVLKTFTSDASCPSVPTSPGILPVMVDALVQTPNTIQYTDQNGATQKIVICYGLAPVSLETICQTDTACGSVLGSNTVSGSLLVPISITLQNGDQYTFSYTPNPGDAYSMGEITSITLPAGGTISYTYGGIAPGFSGRQVLSRTLTENGQSSTWNYNYGYTPGYQGISPPGKVTVTDPYLNDTVYTCSVFGSASGVPPCYMTQEVSYSGEAAAGNPIVSKTTGYTQVGASMMPTSEVLTWNSDNATTETDTSWDSFTPPVHANYFVPGLGYATTLTFGNTMSKTVYDYGSGSHGPLLSYLKNSYLYQSNSAYVTANILDKQTQASVYNSTTPSSSSLVAQTTTAYDAFSQSAQNGLKSTTGTTQHDYTNYSTSKTTRGLPTSVSKYTGPSTAAITTYTNYNDIGKPTVTTDGRGYSTTYTYGSQNAFLSATTLPAANVAHVINESHDLNTGLLNWKEDQNLNKTSYTYDSLMRPLVVTRPPNMGSNLGGGTTTNTYPDPNHVISVTTLDASRSTTSTTVLDGLGRKASVSSTADALCGPLEIDTSYDLAGRVQAVSNPHCAGSQITDGYTTYSYDAIGRLSTKQNPDGSSQTWGFNGNIIDSYDETGRHWQRTYDAADRLTKVLEPNGTTTVNVAPTMETDYAYDTIGNLLNVDQWGGVHGTGPDHARSFSYDAISRLIASNNPESASAATPPAQTCTGTTSGTHWTGCYTYDANSNLKVKTDNRGITISYSYDALNRLTGKTYSDATPAVSFSYDTSSISGSSNDVGEMTQASVASGTKVLAKTTPFAYDTMGRLLTEQQCTPVNCTGTAYSVSSTYDYAGKQLSESFPSNALGSGQPLALTFTYDQAERVLSAGSNWSSSGDAKHPPTLFKASSNTSVPAYGPMGLQNAALGVNSTSGTTTASMQLAYDNRSRVSSGIYTAGASAISGSTSTGSVVISGNEASITKANSSGAATFFPSLPQYGGTHQVCQQVWIPPNPGPGYWETQCTNQPNNGSTQVTIQSQPAFTVTVNWASSQALAAIASAVAAALNTSGSPVAAVANSNGSVTITAVTTGVETNYAVTLNGSVVLY